MGVRTSDTQSGLSLSLCFFVLAGHCLPRELGAQGLYTGPKVVGDTSWCTFCFACFFRLYVTNSARQKNRNKIQLLPNLQQEVEGMGGMRGNAQSLIFLVCFPVCNFEGPKRNAPAIIIYVSLIRYNHMNAENEEASFKSLRIFCMMTSIFTFSHIRKCHFSWSAT